MRIIVIILLSVVIQNESQAQNKRPEDFYETAYHELCRMLEGSDSLSIKKAVYISEWAYYEGGLDYHKDFCDEINRIVGFVNLFYKVNKLEKYKTGKQMALNEYFFRPYSGNNYKPYEYDFENFSIQDENWETQFVSKVLKSHKGQCRSLPWMYKILANELKINAYLAHAPRHCYIMYKDLDNLTPEPWINLEVTNHNMVPSFWIQQDFEISDSAIKAGTYMTPITDKQTVASQLAELAFGYYKKFRRYDAFTLKCVNTSLVYYPMNPNAIIIRGKSLDKMLMEYLSNNNMIMNDYTRYLMRLIHETNQMLNKTFMTVETDEMRNRRQHEINELIKKKN